MGRLDGKVAIVTGSNSVNSSSIATPMAKTDPATLNQDMFGQIIVSDFGATL